MGVFDSLDDGWGSGGDNSFGQGLIEAISPAKTISPGGFMQDIGRAALDLGGQIGGKIGQVGAGLIGLDSGLANAVRNPINDPRVPDLDINTGLSAWGPTVERDTVAGPKTVSPGHGGTAGYGLYGSAVSNIKDAYGAFEAQRQYEMQKRNEAIARAGRGAAGPYDARIASINEKMAQLQGQMERVLPLFGQKMTDEATIYGRTSEELGTSYDDAIADSAAFTEQAGAGIREAYSDAQRKASAVIDKIGGDQATKDYVAAEVGALEDQIWEMNEAGGVEMGAIMQAAERLAVASAKAAGATNALELKRKEVETEMDFKQQLQDLADQRRQAQRARAAAVRAAREAAAARWPSNSMNRQNFSAFAADNFLNSRLGQVNLSENQREFAKELTAQMVQGGISTNDARKILQGNSAVAERYGIDMDEFKTSVGMSLGMSNEAGRGDPSGAVDDYLGTLSAVIPDTLGAFNMAGKDFDTNIASVDPWDLPPDTMARRAGLENFARNTFPNMSEEEVSYFGRDEANHTSEKPAFFQSEGSVGATSGSERDWGSFYRGR